jgi:thiol-disulfide isomerase/thioredoxin
MVVNSLGDFTTPISIISYNSRSGSPMITTLAMVALAGWTADGVSMKFVPSGVTERVGSYRPIRAEMNKDADLVKRAPEGLSAPKYGELKLGNKSWAFILDEPEGHAAKLYVDTNGDGDLTNDPPTTWNPRKTGSLTMHEGKAEVDLVGGNRAALGMYRFDPTDPQRSSLKNTVLFYTDFGYEVTIALDGKDYSSFVSGKPDENSAFWIDRDGNGQQSFKRETVQVDQPFNFTGTTYVLKVSGNDLRLERASESLPVAPLPPDLRVGKKAVAFEQVATDGTKIVFPKTYAGKLVMLDFWATWCGPCIAELPNVKQAYADWHDKGFEVLGVSFDRQGMAEKLKDFTKENEMPWLQLYEGKLWQTELGELYDVSSIPFVLLVDGDSGQILATREQLRGEGLSKFIGDALNKKHAGGQ